MTRTDERRRRAPDPMVLGKGRFESFSDGVFAIAITLLILEVHLPSGVSAGASENVQASALLRIWPQYLVYVASFATIGIMWLNHHALFHNARRITHGVIVANLFLLLLISFLPFPTEVLGQFGLSRPAVVYYGLTLIAISIAYTITQRQVIASHPGTERPLTAWNFVGLMLYPAATAVAFFSPLLGVLLYVLLAAFYMLPSNVQSATLPTTTEV